jgi:hypothetical protein
MKALSASEMLEVWDRGQATLPAERALILIEAASPDESVDALARLSIGRRDSCLLTLREMFFGQDMDCLVACPLCGDQLELDFKVADIRAEPGSEKSDVLEFGALGYEVQFRLPNSIDLIAVAGGGRQEKKRSMLLSRCMLFAGCNGEETSADDLPAELLVAITSKMGLADPQADVQLSLLCPSCGLNWQAVFDIVSFLWSEIDVWARRTLREVHILALAYGWSEADILELSPLRRQLYLDMVVE